MCLYGINHLRYRVFFVDHNIQLCMTSIQCPSRVSTDTSASNNHPFSYLIDVKRSLQQFRRVYVSNIYLFIKYESDVADWTVLLLVMPTERPH